MSDELWKSTDNEEIADTETTVGTEETSEPEETAALFVSAHKQKLAEEEARRIAEEEQAKKDAAAAEVIRMEKDVAAKKKAAATAIKRKIIAIVVGIFVFLIVAFVALTWEDPNADLNYDTLECNGEYKIANPDYDLIVKYPDSIYKEVGEENVEFGDMKCVKLTFKPSKKKAPIITGAIVKEEGNIYDFMDECRDYGSDLDSTVGQFFEIPTDGITTSGFGEDDDGIIKATGTYSMDNTNGAVLCCYQKGGGDGFYFVNYDFDIGTGDVNDAVSMRDLFEKGNSSDLLKRPGLNPPASYELNDWISIDYASLRFPVPKDRYMMTYANLNEDSKEYKEIYVDDNGAYLCFYAIPYYSLDRVFTDEDREKLVKDMSMTAKDQLLFLAEEDKQFYTEGSNGFSYTAFFNTRVNNVKYLEQQCWFIWQAPDAYYVICVTAYIPDGSKDAYLGNFTESLGKIEAIK